MRFEGVTIPAGATVLEAWVQFTAESADSGAANLVISGEAVDDAASFTGADYDITNRTTTAASVAWSPDDWISVGDAGVDQRSPELKSIVQEIVDRPGWVSGNSAVIIVTGTGIRRARSHDDEPQDAALLHILYEHEL